MQSVDIKDEVIELKEIREIKDISDEVKLEINSRENKVRLGHNLAKIAFKTNSPDFEDFIVIWRDHEWCYLHDQVTCGLGNKPDPEDVLKIPKGVANSQVEQFVDFYLEDERTSDEIAIWWHDHLKSINLNDNDLDV